MNSYAMKLICFHLGYSDIQNFTRLDVEESVINPSIEPILNNLSDVQQLEIVGDVDIHNPVQKSSFPFRLRTHQSGETREPVNDFRVATGTGSGNFYGNLVSFRAFGMISQSRMI